MTSYLNEQAQGTTLPQEQTFTIQPSFHFKAKTQVEIKPTAGQSFSGNNTFIEFKIPNRGYIDTRSIHMECKLAVVGTELEDVRLYSVHDLFQRVRVFSGNATFSDRVGYNVLNRAIGDFTISDEARNSQLASLEGQTAWGLNNVGADQGATRGFDNSTLAPGGTAATAATRYYSFRPDCGIFKTATNLPAKWFGQPITIRLYLEDASQAFHDAGGASATITSFTLSDVALIYEELDLGRKY